MICERRGSPEAGQWCSSLGKDRHFGTWSLKLAGAAGASCSGALFCVSIKQGFPELFFGLQGQKRGQDQAMFLGLLRWGGGRGCVVLQARLCLQGPDVAGLHRGPLWAFDPGPESVCPSRPMSLSSVVMQPGGRESSLVSPHVQFLPRVLAFYLQNTPRTSMASVLSRSLFTPSGFFFVSPLLLSALSLCAGWVPGLVYHDVELRVTSSCQRKWQRLLMGGTWVCCGLYCGTCPVWWH